jgi:1-deoxy-D-xylulose-5-phosphate synthase
VGADGATHAGAFDVAYLGCLPNMVLMAAGDEADLVHMVATAAAHDLGPIAFRYPRADGIGLTLPERGMPLDIGKGRILREGTRVGILSYGARLSECLAAAALLETAGISATVADARFAKPLDKALVGRMAREHEALIVVEDGSVGGFCSYVMHELLAQGHLEKGLKLKLLHLPDVFQDHDTQAQLYADAGLDATSIAAAAIHLVKPGLSDPPAHAGHGGRIPEQIVAMLHGPASR